ncbi:MAG TPA: FGGY family carbohydrate kinase [Nocardioides sp.]|nr:FGGY family carbohydrate kinase [Nocardioides sp.]
MAPRHTGLRIAGLDVGTSYVKAVRVELHPGADRPATLAALRRRPTPGDAQELVDVARALLDEVTADGPVAAVGIASMAETGVPLDRAGRALAPLLTWDGERAPSALLGELDRGELFARTGVRLSPKVPLATWAWLAETQPDVHTRMRRWAGAADLVGLALTGRLATDHTLAGRTGAYLLDRDGWAEDLLDLVGLSPTVLPDVVAPDEVVGHAAGVPVVVAGHDHQVGAHACGVRRPGDTADSLGTTEVLLRVLRGNPDRESVRLAGMSLVRTVSGHARALVAGNSSAGSAYASWTADHPASDDLPAGPTGLLVLPYLRGRQSPEPDPRATLRTVGDLEGATPGTLTKALLEGLSLQARWMDDVQRRLDPWGGADGPVVLLGGAGVRNTAWTRVKAEVLTRPLLVVDQDETVAVGAAVVAAERAGLVEPGSVVLPATPVPRASGDPYRELYAAFVREGLSPRPAPVAGSGGSAPRADR